MDKDWYRNLFATLSGCDFTHQQGNARPRHPPSLNSPVKGGFAEWLRRVRAAHRGGKR
jgi:hypothetical protein